MKRSIKLFLLLLTIVITFDAFAVKKVEVGTPSTFKSGGSDRPQASLNFDLSGLSFSSGATQTLPSATGGSGNGSITYTSTTPSICSVSGSAVTALQSGTCRITATRAASGIYAAVSATREVTISAQTQAALSLEVNPNSIAPQQTAQVTFSGGSGNGVVTITSSDISKCTVSGTTITAVASGTCNITATKAASGLYSLMTSAPVSLEVLTAQILTVTAASNSIYTSGTTTLSTSGNQSVVTYAASGSCTVSGSTVTAGSSAGTCTITASAPATAGYSVGSATKTITVNGQPSACWVVNYNSSSCGSGNRLATTAEITTARCLNTSFTWAGSSSAYLQGSNGGYVKHGVGYNSNWTISSFVSGSASHGGLGSVNNFSLGSTQAAVCVTP